MRFFRSSASRADQLISAMTAPLNTIAIAFTRALPLDGLKNDLLKHQDPVAELVDGLSEEEIALAHRTYWYSERRAWESLFETGSGTVDQLHSLQMEWLRTRNPALLDKLVPGRSVPSTRYWSPDIDNVEFTYVESIRVCLPEGDSYRTLMDVTERLSAARRGLAFAGMILGSLDSRPLSPDWIAVSLGAIRSNGRTAAAGWPSHSAMGLPEALDVGAIDGRNLMGWNTSTPQGLAGMRNHIYVGNPEAHYLVPSKIGGNVEALDLSRDGRTAAVQERWTHDDTRIGLIDLETGRRHYLAKYANRTGDEEIQYSPGEDWLLFVSHGKAALISCTSQITIELPIGEVLTASWWPAHDRNAILLVVMSELGPELMHFDCGAAESTSLGRLHSPQPDSDVNRRQYTKLVMHPSDDVALLGIPEGPSNVHQQRFGSRHRVAHLDLENCKITPLVAPFLFDNEAVERQHTDWNWVESSDTIPPDIGDRLMDSATLSELGAGPSFEGHGPVFSNLARLTTTAQYDRSEDCRWLRPEMLRACEAAMASADEDFREWLAGLVDRTHSKIEESYESLGRDPSQWPIDGTGFIEIANSLSLIAAGKGDDLDWTALSHG